MAGLKPEWSEVSTESVSLKVYWGQWSRLVIKDDILYRRWTVKESGNKETIQLVVPSSMREVVLYQLHNTRTAGHLGINKTLERIRMRYFWHGMRKDVEIWCRKCDVCAARKKPVNHKRAPMQKYLVGAPLERIAIDILGPLPRSKRGKVYILLVADYFTRWKEAYALSNQPRKRGRTRLLRLCMGITEDRGD